MASFFNVAPAFSFIMRLASPDIMGLWMNLHDLVTNLWWNLLECNGLQSLGD